MYRYDGLAVDSTTGEYFAVFVDKKTKGRIMYDARGLDHVMKEYAQYQHIHILDVGTAATDLKAKTRT